MKKITIVLIAMLMGYNSVNAQKTTIAYTAEDTLRVERLNKDTRGLKLSSPFGAGALSNFVSNISVTSFFKEGVNGKIELQGKFTDRLNAGLSVDQKIGKSTTEATPLDLTGISPGTTVKFNVQKMFWKPFGYDNLSNSEIESIFETVTKKYASRKEKDFRTVGLKQIADSGTIEEKLQAQEAIEKFGAAIKTPVFINFEMGFTKTSFSYATDSVSLAEIKESFMTPTVSLSFVKALSNKLKITGYVALSYNYSESYTAADDVTFTIPFGTTSNYYTNTVAFGKPTKKTNHNIIAEYRNNIFSRGNNCLALSPSATWSISNKKLSIVVPVYFIKGADENGKLTNTLQGGIRFGYVTSTESGKVSNFKKGFIAQLIISKPLDFFLGKF